MKKILLLAFVAFSLFARAQLTLEHTYDSASVWNTCQGNMEQLMIVNFESSGEHYVKINRCGNRIDIYDMSHVLVQTISMAGLPHEPTYNTLGDVLYLSEKLFDSDPGIEFMYIYQNNGFYTTRIYNADGSYIFSEDGAALVRINFPSQQWPIYNTSVGTKMILSYANGQAKVFGLPGTLTTAIQATTENLLNPTERISNPYPNPTSGTTRIDYTLPEGAREGEIVLFDLSGNEVKRYRVDHAFTYIEISTSDLAAGTYYYQLQTATQNSEGRKMVVIGN